MANLVLSSYAQRTNSNHQFETPFQTTNSNHQFETQFFINELKPYYNLKKPKETKPTSVLFIVRLEKKQIKISTGYKVYPYLWNGNKAIETIDSINNNNNVILNKRIDLFNKRFEEYKELVDKGCLELSKQTLKNYIQFGIMTKQEKPKLDIPKILREYVNKSGLKDSSKDNNYRHIKRFEEYLKDKEIYEYSEINSKLIRGFQSWCIENVLTQTGERTTPNNINKIVNQILALIKKSLVYNDLMTGTEFNDIVVEELKETETDDFIALRDDELIKLYNYKCENEREEKVRDLFLLECTTGVRFSDVEKVDDLIEVKNGRTYINLIQEKTKGKIPVDIIFCMAKDILKKYEYKLPSENKSYFNKKIKEIAKKAGINGIEQIRKQVANESNLKVINKERYNCISSHTGRRTFVTMLSLRGWEANEIARYSGHETLAMIHRYDKSKIGTTEKRMFEDLKKHHPELILKLTIDEKEEIIEEVEKRDSSLSKSVEELIRKDEREKIRTELGCKENENEIMKIYSQIAKGEFKAMPKNRGYIKELLRRDLIREVKEIKEIGNNKIVYIKYEIV